MPLLFVIEEDWYDPVPPDAIPERVSMPPLVRVFESPFQTKVVSDTVCSSSLQCDACASENKRIGMELYQQIIHQTHVGYYPPPMFAFITTAKTLDFGSFFARPCF